MPSKQHSPLPWHVGKSHRWIYTEATAVGRVIVDAEPEGICLTSDEDLEFIVRACNSHDDLIAALEECAREFRMLDKVDTNTTHWGDMYEACLRTIEAAKAKEDEKTQTTGAKHEPKRKPLRKPNA